MKTANFKRDGFLGPVPVLTAEECAELAAHLASDECPAPGVWEKGRALTDERLRKLAADPRILKLLTPLLGENIILWGASVARRKPGQVHRWHSDIESAAPDGRFATIWLGIENTSKDTSLRVIAGSHLCGKSVQQCQAENGRDFMDTPTEAVVEWARSQNPKAKLVDPEPADGDAIIFDGRTWHGSHNRSDEQQRAALILQYAATGTRVGMPDRRVASWPFKFLDEPAPAIVVRGSLQHTGEPIKPATNPHFAQLKSLRPSLRMLDEGPGEDPEKKWQPYPMFRGTTPALEYMACHAALLSAGHSPHPPHSHPNEELLIVLEGEPELLIADGPDAPVEAVPVKAGDIVYYPSLHHHSIRNPSSSPVRYLMFGWRRDKAVNAVEKRLKRRLFRSPPKLKAVTGRGFATGLLFEGPTRWLRKLHCHVSRLEVGAGYAPHADPYDLALLVTAGRIKTLRQEVGPGGLIFCPAGEPHGMRNVGDEPAHYIVFEFHGAQQPAIVDVPPDVFQASPSPALQ